MVSVHRIICNLFFYLLYLCSGPFWRTLDSSEGDMNSLQGFDLGRPTVESVL